MKHLIILANLLLLVASNGWAYNETDLAKLKATNTCEGCDLSGANLGEVNLGGANLTGANLSNANLKNTDFTTTNLKNAKLDGALYCKTKMLWGEVNDDCED